MKVARSLLSKGPSEYSIVARLVYESAQKSGADLRDQEAVEYTKQLQRMTKKRGSSLGQVSHNIAEFLVAHREAVDVAPRRSSSPASVAKPVPMLDIPLRPRVEIKGPKGPVAPSSPKQPQRLDLNIPLRPAPTPVKDKELKLPEAPQPPQPTQPSPPALAPKVTAELVEPAAERTPSVSRPKRVSVVEDKPLFQQTAVVDTPPPSTTIKTTIAPKPSLPKPRVVPLKPRAVPAPTASPTVEPVVEPAPVATSALPSIDDWEAQREREIELMKEAQRAELEAKEAAERELQHKEEGHKWIDLRKEPFPLVSRDDAFFESNKNLYFANSLEQIEAALDAALAVVSVTRPLPAYTLILAANKISSFTPVEREALKNRLVSLATTHKNLYAMKMLQVENCSFEELVALLSSLDAKELARFPHRILRKYLGIQMRANWASALELFHTVKPLVRDQFCTMELYLLTCANARSISLEAKKVISKVLSEAVRSSMHVVGTQHQLAAARLLRTSGLTANSLAARGDATERVYAELIRFSRPERLQEYLGQLGKHGLNPQDPLIATAVMDHKMRNKCSEEVFDLIQQQRDAGVPLMGCHLQCAVRACTLLRTPDSISKTMQLLKEAPASHPLERWRLLMPLMFELDMLQEIVTLYDLYRSVVQSPTIVAVSIVPFLNTALKACNREPLSQAFAEPSAAKKDTATEEATTITTTEVMLEYAKSRNWESAIKLLQTLPKKVNASTMPTLTLQYNCALSAAVQEPDVAISIFEQMKKYDVEQNSTTYNTVMSALSKSDSLWKNALSVFGTIPPSTKDSSSFLVALSILNKHSLWEQSVEVFQRMKATPNMSKPPLVVYELAIGCTHRQSWAVTLKLFQECIRMHGPGSIKEIVASRVIRSLESGRRTDDVLRVQKELDKAKKKKKKE